MRLHFQTKADEHPVFHITPALIEAAALRAGAPSGIAYTAGDDAGDLGWLGDTDGLVCSMDVLADPGFPLHDLAVRAPALRWIHVTGAGIERLLPLTWLAAAGHTIRLTNNSGVHVARTTEYAQMALLMLGARMPEIATNQRRRVWSQVFTSCIAGRTLLVVGLGDMGGAAAVAGRRLGLRVVGIRNGPGAHPLADEMLPVSALHRGLGMADLVVVATPLTERTRHLIDGAALRAMKPGAGLLNIARAGLVDTGALCDSLRSGHLSGAIVDVFDPEPLPVDSPLWDVPNLVVTPHCSSDDLDAYMPLTLDLVFENLIRFRAGAALKNLVDPVRGY